MPLHNTFRDLSASYMHMCSTPVLYLSCFVSWLTPIPPHNVSLVRFPTYPGVAYRGTVVKNQVISDSLRPLPETGPLVALEGFASTNQSGRLPLYERAV